MKGRKGLRLVDGASVVCRLRLKKVEKDLLQAMVDERKVALGARITSIGAAVVQLLRVAFFCLKEHGSRWTPPEQTPLTEDEAIAAGLRIVRRRKRKAGRAKS